MFVEWLSRFRGPGEPRGDGPTRHRVCAIRGGIRVELIASVTR